jgi:hypothetical protein
MYRRDSEHHGRALIIANSLIVTSDRPVQLFAVA